MEKEFIRPVGAESLLDVLIAEDLMMVLETDSRCSECGSSHVKLMIRTFGAGDSPVLFQRCADCEQDLSLDSRLQPVLGAPPPSPWTGARSWTRAGTRRRYGGRDRPAAADRSW
jgi:hypothetical protein